MQLARSAALAGVREFIFLSSVAVNGSTTDARNPFCEQDAITPNTIYGKTKAAAEKGLASLAANGRMSITALRAPMIYGAGAVGSFGKLMSAVRAGLPLPFGLIKNRRALLAHRPAYQEHEAAKADLKKLVPEDAEEAIGHGLRAKRSKSGAISFDLMDAEAANAPL